MRLAAEARFGVRVLLALQLSTSVAGVMLLGRMTPAIEQILTDNVYSMEAVEEMLSVLVTHEDPARFERALARTRGNITEPAEVTLIDAIEASSTEALDGDPAATERVVARLRELAEVNRRSMAAADHEASRLGLAGAWAMALLGFVGFLVSVVVWQRMQARLMAPILEVDRVLFAVRAGDAHRRCVSAGAAHEMERTLANLNWLLDRRLSTGMRPGEDSALRRVLIAALDACGGARVVLVDREGGVIAANAPALAPAADGLVPPEVARRVAAGDPPAGWDVRPLGREGWLACTRGRLRE